MGTTTTVITDDEVAKVREALKNDLEALEIFDKILELADDLRKQLDLFGKPLMIYMG